MPDVGFAQSKSSSPLLTFLGRSFSRYPVRQKELDRLQQGSEITFAVVLISVWLCVISEGTLGRGNSINQPSPDDCNDEKLCKWLRLLCHITLLLGMSVKKKKKKRSFGQALVL